MMTGNDIRTRFLKYFEDRGHRVVPSSSLVPHKDPSLLFTNAGMNQFKSFFLGQETPDYFRAASSQKCVRAGGKHNDLENVGRTARHHTFFEMLGNFSFGDYFKEDAIRFGWEFLTKEMRLPVDHLWVSIFKDDDEAHDIWRDHIKVPEGRILRLGEEDNFWSMGDTGPCGPCSEIHIDQGEEMSCGPNCALGVCDCDRYLELWNLVFMQYNRDEAGQLTPLPKPSIDTGMGLERITAVVQGVKSNYDCDLLRGIISFVEDIVEKRYGENEDDDVSMRVVADHSRASAFLIGDGVLPSNEGRGYVLRRIMRRAARHAKMLGFNDPMLYRTVKKVIAQMAPAYPELSERASFVCNVVKNEEERFIQTLDNGLRILEEEMESLREKGMTVVPGEVVFRLYDTYGFPVDLTADIVENEGFTLDDVGFEVCMQKQRRQARENWKGSGEESINAIYRQLREQGLECTFIGYDYLESAAEILALIKDGQLVDSAGEGDEVEIVFDRTPFYGESGGQLGDSGTLLSDQGRADIVDAQKPLEDLVVHRARIKSGQLQTGASVKLHVDAVERRATALNHTATHLLQSVLVDILGDHVKQAGSLVSPTRLRFDFTHFSALTAEEILRIEDEVNRRIRENAPVRTEEMGSEEAVEKGATALFGEKYGDKVRVVSVGDFSLELCGGTHVQASGDIGLFKFLQETGIAAGVRRIEAATGSQALDVVHQQEQTLEKVAELIKSDPKQLESRISKMLEHQKELERELDKLQSKLSAETGDKILDKVEDVAGIPVLASRIEGTDGKGLRELSDRLRDRMGSGVIVLGCEAGGKANLLVAVTKDLVNRLNAGKIIKDLAAQVGGGGGGRPDLAQAGGSQPEKLDAALAAVPSLIAQKVEAST
ncbi:MAG TPA: alanine--tRNA ligase [Desulfuromonadales bacterium]|nr:alanine--tRNA ligase [Desulfuromonadales bacterium]